MEVLSNSKLNIIVDKGRKGHMNKGLSHCGPMDYSSCYLANQYCGNADGSAVIEICQFPFKARFDETTFISVTGASCRIKINGKVNPPWWRGHVNEGDEIIIEHPKKGKYAYLAITKGFDVDTHLSSRCTDLKAGFGGVNGRGLLKGDRLTLNSDETCQHTINEKESCSVPDFISEVFKRDLDGVCEIRFLPASEWQDFSNENLALFQSEEYSVSNASNRQGMRLSGREITRGSGGELLSHGIIPGTIQIPPDGKPIIQLADANTCGGYPKIGNVIDSDRWKLGQLTTGAKIKFKVVTLSEALVLDREYEEVLLNLFENKLVRK